MALQPADIHDRLRLGRPIAAAAANYAREAIGDALAGEINRRLDGLMNDVRNSALDLRDRYRSYYHQPLGLFNRQHSAAPRYSPSNARAYDSVQPRFPAAGVRRVQTNSFGGIGKRRQLKRYRTKRR